MHSITVIEAATNVVAQKQVYSAIPCALGTAPIHLGTERTAGKPVIAYSYEEAVEKLGYSDDWKTYTLCEAMYVWCKVFRISPVVFVNAIDAEKNITTLPTGPDGEGLGEMELTADGRLIIKDEGILPESVKIDTLTAGTDFTVSHNENGHVVIIGRGDTVLSADMAVSYSRINPKSVTGATVCGLATKLDDVYHVCGELPSTLIAPGFDREKANRLLLSAAVKAYDGIFSAVAAVDICPDESDYSAVVTAAKDTADTYTVQCWPCAPLDDTHVVHRSVIYAGMCATTDAEYGGIPYASPSNRPLPIGGLCTADGKEITLNKKQADAVENAGVYTAVRLDTWKAWGTYTSAINASNDPKDIFIAIRRMLNWHKNTFTVNYFAKVDNPANTRLIEDLVDNENKRIDGLKAIGAVAGGRISFPAAENPVGNIMAGKLRFRQRLGFWPPAREIENVIEIDADLVKAALGGE